MNSAPLILAASQSGLRASKRSSKAPDFQVGRRPQQTTSPGRDAHANGPMQEAPHRVPRDSPGAATSDTAGLLDGRVPHSDHTQRCGRAARLRRWAAFPQTPQALPALRLHPCCWPTVGTVSTQTPAHGRPFPASPRRLGRCLQQADGFTKRPWCLQPVGILAHRREK